MHFPDTFRIKVIDNDTNIGVANVAIALTLKAERKNDYSVGPRITDENGNVAFSRIDCEEAIESAKQMFLMDYIGDLASCGPTLEVSLHPPQFITGMIRQYKQDPIFWGSAFAEPAKLFASLESVHNSNFSPAEMQVHESALQDAHEVELRIQRREHALR